MQLCQYTQWKSQGCSPEYSAGIGFFSSRTLEEYITADSVGTDIDQFRQLGSSLLGLDIRAKYLKVVGVVIARLRETVLMFLYDTNI